MHDKQGASGDMPPGLFFGTSCSEIEGLATYSRCDGSMLALVRLLSVDTCDANAA